MERLEIFPLKLMEPLALVSFVGLPDRAGFARVFFGYLSRQGITTPFLVEAAGRETSRDLIFAVTEEQFKGIQDDLESLRGASRAETVRVDRPVAMVRVLGPHFDIRPGVTGYLFGRLKKDGIQVLASSTTITTMLLVVPLTQAEQLITLLESSFVLPGRK